MHPQRVLFLPGANGNTTFWEPVVRGLDGCNVDLCVIGWPGVGGTPLRDGITSVDHFAECVASLVDRPTALIAQSMGCVVALKVAATLGRRVTHLVLSGLSAGFDRGLLGGRSWQPSLDVLDPLDPGHAFARYRDSIEPLLGRIEVPSLLLWGCQDDISPPPVGKWVARRLVDAKLVLVDPGSHTCCLDRAEFVLPLIHGHLFGEV